MGDKEKKIINDTILAGANYGRLFRANAGQGWTGKVVRIDSKRLVLYNPRVFHGLPPGFSDIFGFKSVVITPNMVGMTIAQFVAIEVKTGNIPVTEKQELFLNTVEKFGGIAEIIREK